MMNSGPETEDITQEVFLRLWTQAGRFNPTTARLSTWLHKIAHNLCIDFLRKQGRLTEEFPEEPEASDEPDAQLLASRSANDTREALSGLPERQRSAIIMSHYQGLSNKETAEILSVSVDALESLLVRARRTLRNTLQERDQ
jgi:RNA polymerase sigma-70 factor (ECF subfamily)